MTTERPAPSLAHQLRLLRNRAEQCDQEKAIIARQIAELEAEQTAPLMEEAQA